MAIKDRLVPRYLKNAGRSLLYATADVLKDSAPDIIQFTTDSKDVISDSYNSIKEFLFEKNDQNQNIFEEGGSVIKQIFKNSLEDLKSGDWYNKSRDDQMGNDMAAAMGFDFNFDDDFGDFDDWGEDDESSSSDNTPEISTDTKASIVSEKQSTAATIRAMDAVGAGIASSVNHGLTASSSYIVKSTQGMLSSLHHLNKTGFAQVSSAVAGVNKTFTEFATLISKPLSDHIRNSTEYYIKSEKTITEIKSLLEKIANKDQGYNNYLNKSSKTKTLSDFVNGGIFDISGYKDFVVNQAKDAMSLFTSMGEMAGGRKGLMGMAKNASIPRMALKWGVNRLIPDEFKDSLEKFNKEFSNATINAFKKLTTMKTDSSTVGGWLLDVIKENFLPKDVYNNKLDTGKYYKGSMPWDGQAKKALVEVIPTTLLKIYSAITGGPDYTYDYEKGKFTTTSRLREERFKADYETLNRAGGDFMKEAYSKFDKNDTKALEGIQNFFRTLLEDPTGKLDLSEFAKGDYEIHGIGAERNKQKQKLEQICKDYGIPQDRAAEIIPVLQDCLKSGKFNDFQANLILVRQQVSAENERDNLSGMSRYISVYNDSGIMSGRAIGIGGNRRYKNAPRQGEVTDAEANAKKFKEESTAYQLTQMIKDNAKVQEENEKSGYWTSWKDKDGKAVSMKDFINNSPLKDDKFFSRMAKVFTSSGKMANSLFATPFMAAAKMLDTISESINRFFWGPKKGEEGEKGFFQRFGDKINDLTKEFFGWDEGIIDKFKGFWTDTKASLMSAGRSVVDSARDKFAMFKAGLTSETADEYRDRIIREQHLNPDDEAGIQRAMEMYNDVEDFEDAMRERQFAYGAKEVKKTGMAAVSKGEMIIPSDFNPFYHGSNDKATQLRNEMAAAKRFYGFNAGGALAVGRGARGQLIKIKDYLSGKYNTIKQKATDNGYTFDTGKKKVDWKEVSKLVGQDFKTARGNMGAGGIFGAIGGSMLGLGPIPGLILGSTIGFVTKSEGLQKMLFGDKDDNGERKGGLISKDLSNFVTKYAKSVGKGGLAGAVAGLITPLGPVGGAIAGAAAGFISKSEGAKDFLFGKEDPKTHERVGGLISAKLQKRFKGTNLTKIGIGAAAGLLLGPSNGLVANMMIGAGLGFLTTSDRVHRFLFGGKKKNWKGEETEVEGFLPYLKRLTIDRIVDIGKNLKTGLVNGIKDLVARAKERIDRKKQSLAERLERNALVKHLKDTKLGQAVGTAYRWTKDRFGSIGGALIKAPFALATAPLGAIRHYGHHVRLMHGDNVYDSKLGRNLSASERLQRRNRLVNTDIFGDDRFYNIDSAINNIMSNPNMSNEAKQEALAALKEEIQQAAENPNETSAGFDIEASKLRQNLFQELNSQGFGGEFGLLNTRSLSRTGDLLKTDKELKETHQYKSLLKSRPDLADKYLEIMGRYRDQYSQLKAGSGLFKDKYGITGKLGKRDFERFSDLVSNESDLLSSQMAADAEKKQAELEAKKAENVNDIHELLANAANKDDGSIKVNLVNSEDSKGTAGSIVNNGSNDNDPEVMAYNIGLTPLGDGRYVSKDADGKMIYHRFRNGEFVPDESDKETMKEMKQDEDVQNAQITTADYIKKLSDIESLSGKSGSDIEKDAKKSSTLSTLLSLIGGGVSSGLSKFFGFASGLGSSGIIQAIGSGLSNFFGVAKGAFFTYLIGNLVSDVVPSLLFGSGKISETTANRLSAAGKSLTKGLAAAKVLKIIPGPVGAVLAGGAVALGAAGAVWELAKNVGHDAGFVDVDKEKVVEATEAQAAVHEYQKENSNAQISSYENVIDENTGNTYTAINFDNGGRIMVNTANTELVKKVTIDTSEVPSLSAAATNSNSFRNYFESVSDFKEYCNSSQRNYNHSYKYPLSYTVWVKDNNNEVIDAVDGTVLMNPYYNFAQNGYSIAKSKSTGDIVYYKVYAKKNGEEFEPTVFGKFADVPKDSWFGRFWANNKMHGILHAIVIKGSTTSLDDKQEIINSFRCAKYNKNLVGGKTYEFSTYGYIIKIKNASCTRFETNSTLDSTLNELYTALGWLSSNAKFMPDPATYGLVSTMSNSDWNNIVETYDYNTNMLNPYVSENDPTIGSAANKFISINRQELDYAANEHRIGESQYFENKAKEITGTIDFQTSYSQQHGGIRTTSNGHVVFMDGTTLNLSDWNDMSSGFGSGLFLSQYDPRYANKRFGNGTVASSGCAPAVAAMVGSHYGKGLSMNSAMSGARSYLGANGTSINYFNDIFSKNGIKSGITNNAADIYNSLQNGEPVVLLGQNAANTSKDLSPFGPNAHYVMAKGIDANGNIIVNDPEMSHSTKYSPQILKSVNNAVVTSGKASGLESDDKMMKLAEAIVKTLGNIAENTEYMKDVAENTSSIKTTIDMSSTKRTSKRYASGGTRSVRSSAVTSGANSMITSLQSLAQG